MLNISYSVTFKLGVINIVKTVKTCGAIIKIANTKKSILYGTFVIF